MEYVLSDRKFKELQVHEVIRYIMKSGHVFTHMTLYGGPRGLPQGVQITMICVNTNVFMIWADIYRVIIQTMVFTQIPSSKTTVRKCF